MRRTATTLKRWQRSLKRVASKAFFVSLQSCGCVEMVDKPDLGSGAERRGGSSPPTRTSTKKAAFRGGSFVAGGLFLDQVQNPVFTPGPCHQCYAEDQQHSGPKMP